MAPSGTPADVVAKIGTDVQRVLTDPAFKDKFLVPNRYEPLPGSPAEFAAFMQADTRKWAKVIKDTNVKVVD
jgi:tripartite-type tricarboxylate transporter receptor subunit TctC